MNYIDFFKCLGNPSPICFVNNNIKIKHSDIDAYIDNNDLFFIPNSGGTKTEEITGFNAFFVDLDAGRDSNNNYLPGKLVKKYKTEQMQKIKKFQIPVNAILETRNGYHLYWFIREEIDLRLWNTIENALISYFGADSKVCTAAHQMRIPGTWWLKDKAHPFRCRLLELNNTYTYIETYCTCLNIKESESKKESEKIFSKFRYKKPTAPKSKPQYPKKTFANYNEMFNYITKEISMFDYLKSEYGLEGNNQRSFKCIIHNDNHPSASIFRADSGSELYCCNSTSCGFKGNIVQVVAKIEGCSRTNAINKLCNDLNITFEEKAETIRFLLDNIRSIDDDIQYSHKNLYNAVYRYLPTLRTIHMVALRNLIYANDTDKFLFSASTQYISNEMGRKDKKNTTADLAYLCLLKLLEKVDLDSDEVPEEYRRSIKNFQGNRENYINIFSLPEYNYNTLTECDEMAKQVKEKGIRKTHFSYESVVNAFGSDTADRIFPQIKGKKVKELDGFLITAVEFLLEKDGYFSQGTIKAFYSDNEIFFKEKTFIRQLPQIMEKYNLQKVKTSKKLKNDYNILSSGFPYIYIKQGI